jgi:hypothetical protein
MIAMTTQNTVNFIRVQQIYYNFALHSTLHAVQYS